MRETVSQMFEERRLVTGSNLNPNRYYETRDIGNAGNVCRTSLPKFDLVVIGPPANTEDVISFAKGTGLSSKAISQLFPDRAK